MNYADTLAHMATLQFPTRSKGWKAILADPESFKRWVRSKDRTQEQKLQAQWPQLFKAINLDCGYVTPSRGDGPIALEPSDFSEATVEYAAPPEAEIVDLDA